MKDAADEAGRRWSTEWPSPTTSCSRSIWKARNSPGTRVTAALKVAVAAAPCLPVVPVSATKNIGSDRLLELLVCRPLPLDREARGRPWRARRHRRGEADGGPASPTALFVFKTIYDQFSGRVNLARLFSGKIATDTQLLNIRTGEKERTGNILLMQGKETKAIEEAGAGDIVALAKLKETGTGDTLSDPARPVRFPPVTSSRRLPSPSPSRQRRAGTRRR